MANKQRIISQHLSGVFFGLSLWVLLLGTILGGSVLYWTPIIIGIVGFGVRPPPRLRRLCAARTRPISQPRAAR